MLPVVNRKKSRTRWRFHQKAGYRRKKKSLHASEQERSRCGVKGRALLQRAGFPLYNLSVSLRSTAPLVGEPLAKPFTLRGLPRPPLARGGGIASAMTERLDDGSRAVSTKKDPLSEIAAPGGGLSFGCADGVFAFTFAIFIICHPPQKSSAVQKVYSFAHTPGTSSLRASSRRAVPSGRSLAASIWPGETW